MYIAMQLRIILIDEKWKMKGLHNPQPLTWSIREWFHRLSDKRQKTISDMFANLSPYRSDVHFQNSLSHD